MPHGPRRPGFYLGVLAVGFVMGGLLQAFLRRFLPQGPAKELFTWSVTPTIGPVHLDLLVMSITLGPIGVEASAEAWDLKRSLRRSTTLALARTPSRYCWIRACCSACRSCVRWTSFWASHAVESANLRPTDSRMK